MTQYKVLKVDENWTDYCGALDEYVGQVLEQRDSDYDDCPDGVCLWVEGRSDWWWFERSGCELIEDKPVVERNKYMREIAPGVWVDVYDVLYAFAVTDPCLQHLLKKALATGIRGHKSTREDLIDIRDSAIRAVEHYDLMNPIDKNA